MILGAGKRLFDGFDQDMELEVAKVYSSPYATHIRYTVTEVAAVMSGTPPCRAAGLPAWRGGGTSTNRGVALTA